MQRNRYTIAYVGNFKQTHCTETHVALSLEDMGHEVIRIQEDGVSQARLTNILTENKIDLFLFTRTWDNTVTLGHLELLRKRGIPSASLHLDLYIGLKRESGLDHDPFWRTDYVFSPDGDPASAEVFKKKGINHIWSKPAVFKLEAEYGTPREEFRHDVVFVGGGANYGHPEWPYRQQLIAWLRETYGERFAKYGYPERTVRNRELNDLYASAKVVVGDTLCLGFNKPNYWSDRVCETMGRGGFIIHPFIEGMQEDFSHEENIVYYHYRQFDDLKDSIDFYLSNDGERERIRKAGHDLVKEKHTYHNRLQNILETVFDGENQQKIVEKPIMAQETDGIKINLGSGNDPYEGFINVDLLDLPNVDKVHNLMDFPYPFDDESASEIRAADVIEHLDHYTADRRPTIIAFIEECFRILKPGGKLWIQAPGHDAAFMWTDPTHVRGFTAESMDFFDPEKPFGQTTGFYSKAKFSVSAVQLENRNLQFTMTKI